MAIVQISQIKHRRGNNENLPQLSSAELGWSVDTRQLYIGNGTLAEGAPEIGNTEILTEFSSIPGVPTTYSQTITANTTANLNPGGTYDSNYPSLVINYAVERGANIRTGFFRISQLNSQLSYDEEYDETGDIGFTLAVTTAANVITISATAANTSYNAGIDANIKFAPSTFSF